MYYNPKPYDVFYRAVSCLVRDGSIYERLSNAYWAIISDFDLSSLPDELSHLKVDIAKIQSSINAVVIGDGIDENAIRQEEAEIIANSIFAIFCKLAELHGVWLDSH